jgi:hypothetical protein
MKLLNHGLAGFSGTLALSALALAGCSSSGSGTPGADASTDATTVVDSAPADTSVADGGAVNTAPCTMDASILAPVDPIAHPTAAACRACLVDPTSMVPTGAGSGTCLANLQACSEDCSCAGAFGGIDQCLDGDGGSAATCVLDAVMVFGEKNIPFNALVGCQTGPCQPACGGNGVAQRTDGGGGSLDGGTDSGSDGASAGDAARDSASDATATGDAGTGDATADDAADGDDNADDAAAGNDASD